MCKNQDCPLRKSCYRFMAEPDTYQWYTLYHPDEKGKCDFFEPIIIGDRLTTKNDTNGDEA